PGRSAPFYAGRPGSARDGTGSAARLARRRGPRGAAGTGPAPGPATGSGGGARSVTAGLGAPGPSPSASPSPSPGPAACARADSAQRRTVRPGAPVSSGGATVRRGDSKRARPSPPARGRRRNPSAGEVGKPKRLRKPQKAGKTKEPKKPGAGARAETVGHSAR